MAENQHTSTGVPRSAQGALARSLSVAVLWTAASAALPGSAVAADIRQNHAIDCQVSDGRGAIVFGPSKHLGEAAGTRRFSQWEFASDGVNLGDRIGLFWAPSAGLNPALRVAIDGPVSKPTQLISATKDTLVAVAVTSDQYTTRGWLITINFPQETAMITATSSGAVAVKAQTMVMSCTFKPQQSAKALKSAADSWQR